MGIKIRGRTAANVVLASCLSTPEIGIQESNPCVYLVSLFNVHDIYILKFIIQRGNNMIEFEKIKALFEQSNISFLNRDFDLFEARVSEQTLCGALMLQIYDNMKSDEIFNGYFVDVEYNRNRGEIKTMQKTMIDPQFKVVRIKCDLIVHSRGRKIEQDNLLAIEMKKSNRSIQSRDEDRERMRALTKDSFDNVWSFDGKTLPEHVCRYGLGVYYEINLNRKKINIEYYRKGELVYKYSIDLFNRNYIH